MRVRACVHMTPQSYSLILTLINQILNLCDGFLLFFTLAFLPTSSFDQRHHHHQHHHHYHQRLPTLITAHSFLFLTLPASASASAGFSIFVLKILQKGLNFSKMTAGLIRHVCTQPFSLDKGRIESRSS